MSTKNKFFMSIDIIGDKDKDLYDSIETKIGVDIIDISIHINDYRITVSDINGNNRYIELSYNNNKSRKYNNASYLLRKYGNINLHYNRYNILQINNLFIVLNFVIHKLFKKIINKFYSYFLIEIYNYGYTLEINDIKKINFMRLYKSLYYMSLWRFINRRGIYEPVAIYKSSRHI